MQIIPASELVLNAGGSIYHLNLHPEQVAPTVFLVGDPGRVPRVSKYFDRIEHQVQRREFITHTGELGGKRLSVISTGIGTDNIDIVLNELDALVNINLKTREVNEKLTSLEIIRLGTSGSLSNEIQVEDLVISAFGIGMDNLLSYYNYESSPREAQLRKVFIEFMEDFGIDFLPFAAEADQYLLSFLEKGMKKGITLTCPGFYGPQGRNLRLKSVYPDDFFRKTGNFEFEDLTVTNFEMETSAILGLAKMLGHKAVSCNAILANRVTHEFSANPAAAVDKLIGFVLEKVSS